MSKNVRALHVELPEKHYNRLKQMAEHECITVRQMVIEALEFLWNSGRGKISLREALFVEAVHRYGDRCSNAVIELAYASIPSQLQERANKVLDQAEEAKLIIPDDDTFIWIGFKEGSEKKRSCRIDFTDDAWLDELLEMAEKGFLEEKVKKTKDEFNKRLEALETVEELLEQAQNEAGNEPEVLRKWFIEKLKEPVAEDLFKIAKFMGKISTEGEKRKRDN